MTARKKKTETALAVVEDQLPAELLAQMEGDKHLAQTFDTDQMIIPRLNILQDLSPQVKERSAEFIPEAKVGMFYNNLNRLCSNRIELVPAKFDVRYLAWKPRNDGGGLVSSTLTLEEVRENFDEDGFGSWVGMMAPRQGEPAVRVEVQETPEWVGYARAENWNWMPVAISFPGTKAKAARWMNTTVNMARLQGKNGPFMPAPFYHLFSLTTAIEKRNEDEWFGFRPIHEGYFSDPAVIKDAKELKISLERGEATVAEEQQAA